MKFERRVNEMLRLILIGSLLCIIFGYLVFKICIYKKRKRKIIATNKNASTSGKRSKKTRKVCL